MVPWLQTVLLPLSHQYVEEWRFKKGVLEAINLNPLSTPILFVKNIVPYDLAR